MAVDRALLELDLVRLPEGEAEILHEALREQFKLFLGASGAVSWDLWVSLSDTSRRALVEAQEELLEEDRVDTALEDSLRRIAP